MHRSFYYFLKNSTQQLVDFANNWNTWSVCWAGDKISERFDNIMDSHNQRLFAFYSNAAFFQNIFLFLMLIADNIFFHGSVNERSKLRKFEAECR